MSLWSTRYTQWLVRNMHSEGVRFQSMFTAMACWLARYKTQAANGQAVAKLATLDCGQHVFIVLGISCASAAKLAKQ
jgi:hypothetical protein